jgi:hypothetical protein
MADEEVSIRQLVSRVELGSFRGYLIERGWSEKPSRYIDHVYFQGAIHDGGIPYDLYLPVSPDIPKYHATLMRAIYKLCGIEDREPQDIARDVIASKIAVDRPAAGSATKARLRVSNSGSRPLQLRIDSPGREHELLPGEAIELVCDVAATGSLEIEHGDDSLTIVALGKR